MASGFHGVLGAHVIPHVEAEHAFVTEPAMDLSLVVNHARVMNKIQAVATSFPALVCP